MKKSAKIIIITACVLIGAILLAAISYVAYVLISYYRLEDRLPLKVSGTATEQLPTKQTVKLLTYNIGFGAYSDDYSFFMDGGEHSRAYSAQAVKDNTAGALGLVKSYSPDIVLFQEVDVKGTRSYNVDQTALLASALAQYDRVFAQNYDSPYLFYPFDQPIGANKSGIMSFSRYNITEAHRRSLPIEESLYKLVDLDRAYSVSTVPTDNGKSLVLYNVHLSAYTSDGTIADEQLRMLAADMEAQYKLGNYVIAAGDFNKDLLGDSSKYFTRGGEDEFTWAKPFDTSLLPDGFSVHTGTNAPTCRNADSAYKGDGSDFVLSVDGFIISPNVEFVTCETLSDTFAFSDHNPVRMEVVLG